MCTKKGGPEKSSEVKSSKRNGQARERRGQDGGAMRKRRVREQTAAAARAERGDTTKPMAGAVGEARAETKGGRKGLGAKKRKTKSRVETQEQQRMCVIGGEAEDKAE